MLIDIIMGYDCNAKCDYCTVSDDMRGQNLSTEAIEQAIRRARRDGFSDISFNGGEPTIRKDLPALVRLAKRIGFGTVKIQSNGLMYAYGQYVDTLLEAGANRFNISTMAHTPELYEQITGLPGSLELVTRGIRNLLDRNATVILDQIMKSDTFRHLPEIVRYFNELGARRFVLWLVSLTENNRENLESLVPVPEMKPFIIKCFDMARQGGFEVLSRHIPRCYFPGYEDHVWNVRWDKVRVVTPNDSFDLLESAISTNVHASCCRDCAVFDDCPGLRRDYLERYGESEIKPIGS